MLISIVSLFQFISVYFIVDGYYRKVTEYYFESSSKLFINILS